MIQQARAADAASEGVALNYAQTILALAGVMLGFFTLAAATAAAWFAKRAADETRRSANAAIFAVEATNEANKISRQVAHQQLRPYVYICEEHIKISIFNLGENNRFAGDEAPVKITFRNYGHIPARKVRFYVRTLIEKHHKGAVTDKVFEEKPIPFSDMPNGLDHWYDEITVTGIKDAYDKLRERKLAIYVDGRITYEDSTRRKYQTDFQFCCTGKAIDDSKLTLSWDGNAST